MSIARLIGNEVPSQMAPYSQVYMATHDGQLRLPYMQRSFISFSYGGKYIEDFNLIAYTDGDRMESNGYADFEDLTTTYDTLPGQFYWGTYFHANTLSFKLATDGITQTQLDDFKHWFRAGVIRELILAEHPNRAIMARISSQPQLHLLAFKEEVQVPFQVGDTSAGEATSVVNYSTYTTLYRGAIDIEFVMDEPFWYSVQNILGVQDTREGYYKEHWVDANGVETTIKNSPDALKIIYEDHIPLGSTTRIDVFLGGGVYASVSYDLWSKIPVEISQEQYEAALNSDTITPQERSAYFTTVEPRPVTDPSTGQTSTQNVTCYYQGAVIAYEVDGSMLGAKVGGAHLIESDHVEGISLSPHTPANLYYAGTAPSPVKLRFTLKPQLKLSYDSTGYYIISPLNSYSSTGKYNSITLRSVNAHAFKFTIPTFWLSYNQVIEIFHNQTLMANGSAWLTVRETIRDTIRHPVIREWANLLINKYDAAGGNGLISNSGGATNDLIQGMAMLICDNNEEPFPASFTFDGKTGLAIGRFTYRDASRISNLDSSQGLKAQIKSTTNGMQVENYAITSEENVGDMVKSCYLILDERNVLDKNFQVQAWESAHPDYAYMIVHDVVNGLEDLHFEFKNLYL